MKSKNKTIQRRLGELEELPERFSESGPVKSRRRASAEAFRQSEEAAKILLNASVDASLLINFDGVLLALNEVAAQRFGRSSQALIGMNFFEFLTYDMAEEFRARASGSR